MGAPEVHRKQYWTIFVVLAVLTALEVGVVFVPGVGKTALAICLIGMALGKAWLVAWFFMHLNHETKAMRITVLLPFLFPAVYAVALIGDAVYRLTQAQ